MTRKQLLGTLAALIAAFCCGLLLPKLLPNSPAALLWNRHYFEGYALNAWKEEETERVGFEPTVPGISGDT